MRLIILAGGFGTRLRSSIGEQQKAMAPVGETNFMSLQLKNWKNQGVREFTFLLHYRANDVKQLLDSLADLPLFKGCEIEYLIEDIPLGTGGALKGAFAHYSSEPEFLVCNGDTWLSGGLQELIHASPNTIGVIPVKNIARYGQVVIDDSLRITSFVEKRTKLQSGLINAGIYKLSWDFFKYCKEEIFSVEDYFTELINHGERLQAKILNTDFIDIGIPDDYEIFLKKYQLWEERSVR